MVVETLLKEEILHLFRKIKGEKWLSKKIRLYICSPNLRGGKCTTDCSFTELVEVSHYFR